MAYALVMLVFFAASNVVVADCIYNGRSYSEGSKVGPYECENSRWIVK
jgi:hypothetical protein